MVPKVLGGLMLPTDDILSQGMEHVDIEKI